MQEVYGDLSVHVDDEVAVNGCTNAVHRLEKEAHGSPTGTPEVPFLPGRVAWRRGWPPCCQVCDVGGWMSVGPVFLPQRDQVAAVGGVEGPCSPQSSGPAKEYLDVRVQVRLASC